MLEGASTPLTAFYLSKEIAYYRRYLQYMNHISQKPLGEETWFNEQLNNVSKLNSKIAELTAYSQDLFHTSATNIIYDTFDVGTPTSIEGGTSTRHPTIVDGCITKKYNKHFSSDDCSDDNNSTSYHSTSGDKTKVVSAGPDEDPPDETDDDAFSKMSLNSDTPSEDNKPQTTKLMKSLLKIASSIGLKKFSMEGDFQSRRRFNDF